MSNSILSSIIACTTTNQKGELVWPEVWDTVTECRFRLLGYEPENKPYGHPAYLIFQMAEESEHGKIGMNELKDLKLIRHDFAHLVKEVEKDPQNNAAVRAFGGERAEVSTFDISVYGRSFFMGTIEKNLTYLLSNQHQTGMHAWRPCRVLRSEGYAVGIPRDHYITEQEIAAL